MNMGKVRPWRAGLSDTTCSSAMFSSALGTRLQRSRVALAGAAYFTSPVGTPALQYFLL